MKIPFATSNPHKVREANEVGKGYDIEFVQLNEPYPEIRDEDVGRVAFEGARHVYEKTNKAVIVEDTGLYVDALCGFPGPYSAYAYKRIGCAGILKLLAGEADRKAVFISAIGYCDRSGARVFRGECAGSIPTEERGPPLFGYDPIFIPHGGEKTFAQDPAMKHRVSHRRKAFEGFCEDLASSKDP
ncbi:MAG: RdgB/HAM1 family non-canonical purine NTP pyrophosphatase [Candidatus Altiarchaeota archaeon]|nr:RdgB/HAM1 family non-canonical purine NTP pyrophosphatase [Candidatus Altiarchaeota archaeon]